MLPLSMVAGASRVPDCVWPEVLFILGRLYLHSIWILGRKGYCIASFARGYYFVSAEHTNRWRWRAFVPLEFRLHRRAPYKRTFRCKISVERVPSIPDTLSIFPSKRFIVNTDICCMSFRFYCIWGDHRRKVSWFIDLFMKQFANCTTSEEKDENIQLR